jgi:hypothetical protein
MDLLPGGDCATTQAARAHLVVKESLPVLVGLILRGFGFLKFPWEDLYKI